MECLGIGFVILMACVLSMEWNISPLKKRTDSDGESRSRTGSGISLLQTPSLHGVWRQPPEMNFRVCAIALEGGSFTVLPIKFEKNTRGVLHCFTIS